MQRKSKRCKKICKSNFRYWPHKWRGKKIFINDLSVGFYNITVFNNESMNYNPSNATALFSIVKSYSKVNITSITDGILNTQNVTVKFDVLAPTIINIIVIFFPLMFKFGNTILRSCYCILMIATYNKFKNFLFSFSFKWKSENSYSRCTRQHS